VETFSMIYAGGRDDVDEDDESEVDEDDAEDIHVVNGEDSGLDNLWAISLLLFLSWIDIHDDVDGAKASTEKVVT